MKPPPPRLPASGSTTAIANPTATAASTALPPRRNTSRPATLAMSFPDVTMACGPRSERVAAGYVHESGKGAPGADVVGAAVAATATRGAGAGGAEGVQPARTSDRMMVRGRVTGALPMM